MANPYANSGINNIDGIWFAPYYGFTLMTNLYAWVGSKSPALEGEMSSSIYTIFDRPAKVSNQGVLHLDEGTISGMLLDRNGQTATTWMNRLQYLINNQSLYTIYLLSNRYVPFPVEFYGSLVKDPVQAGGYAWEVTFSIRQTA